MSIEHVNKYQSRELLRTFANGDREYSHEFGIVPINYTTIAGTFKPINTGMNDYIDEVYDFGISQVDLKVRFPNVETAPVDIYKDNGDNIKSRFKGLVFYNRVTGESISLGILKPQPVQHVLLENSSEMLYEDVYNGVDLKYFHAGHYIKQLVIISEAFRNTLTLPDGWNAEDTLVCKVNNIIKSGDSILIKHAHSHEVLIDGNDIIEGVTWSIFSSSIGNVILNATFTDQGTTSKDCYIVAHVPDTVFNDDALNLLVPYTAQPTVRGRSPVEFDISSIDTETFTSATFSVYKKAHGGTWTDRSMSVHTISAAWIETQATWNDRVTSTAWGTAGGDFGAPNGDDNPTCSSGDSTNTEYQFDVLSIADGWKSTNEGLIIKWTDDSTERAATENQIFYSSEHVTAGTRPKLVIVYTSGYANKALGIADSDPMGIDKATVAKFCGG